MSPVRVNADESSWISNSNQFTFTKQGDLNVVACLRHFPAKMPFI